MEREQSQSQLFSLPQELRDLIYGYAMTHNSPIMDAEFTDPHHTHQRYLAGIQEPQDPWAYPEIVIALRSTCKRIQREMSISPFYTNNDFHFTRPLTLRSFTTRTPPTYLRLVEYITLETEVNWRCQRKYDLMWPLPEFTHYLRCTVDEPSMGCEQWEKYHFRDDFAKLQSLRGLMLNVGIDSPFGPKEGVLRVMRDEKRLKFWNDSLKDGVDTIKEYAREPATWFLVRDSTYDGKAKQLAWEQVATDMAKAAHHERGVEII